MAKQQQAGKLFQEANRNVSQEKGITIKYPSLILCVIVTLLYAGSINFGYTDLDDTIFIREMQGYNEQLSNLLHSFQRGVFSEADDTYYRPLLLDSYILNHALSDTDIKGYHLFNLLLHLLSVCLLFIVFVRVGIDRNRSFLLTALFAVHPVLSQAVVWVPGRNDTLLAISSFAFMICAFDFMQSRKVKFLLAQFVFLLAALFTKETAVFIAPALMVVCIAATSMPWKDKRNFLLYGSWLLAIGVWFAVRSMATIKDDPIQLAVLAKNFPLRLSLSVQYLGKILLPFNLSVFPMLKETGYVFGAIAIAVLAALIWFSKSRNNALILAGFIWFFLLLFPLFVLPSALNDQDFEHRLYLPILGILLVLSQTALFQNMKETTMVMVVVLMVIGLGGLNLIHQQSFRDPVSFWTAAVNTSPNSSYANMMLAARVKEIDPKRSDELMRNAYQINPREKYVNYYLGKDFLDRNAVDSAEKYLLAELKTSAYYNTYFLLSRVALEKKDSLRSLNFMETYLEKDPGNSQAMNNYILLLCQTNQWERARAFIAKKQTENIMVPKALIDLANGNTGK